MNPNEPHKTWFTRMPWGRHAKHSQKRVESGLDARLGWMRYTAHGYDYLC
jgi:hypothetical protein